MVKSYELGTERVSVCTVLYVYIYIYTRPTFPGLQTVGRPMSKCKILL